MASRSTLASTLCSFVACLLLGTGLLNAQDQRPKPGARESMWPSPTAEDWAKPCLIQWERTWDDALAASKESGRPILICVNMDGEIASEHYAGIRYREPEITDLYAPYITVIASVYRHTTRDYDEEGKRVLCPRFGSVTCQEHIRIEPLLFKQYFDGQRIAPRHIVIELDAKEAFDVFYALDTKSVFERIEKQITERDEPLPPRLENQGPIEDRVLSPHNRDKAAVEEAYLNGSKELKRRVMQKVVSAGEQAPLDLMRLAVFGLDMEMARLARQGLAQTADLGSLDLLSEALKVPMDEAEREALIAALERLSSGSSRARTLAFVHRGLVSKSNKLNVKVWSSAQKGTKRRMYKPKDRSALEAGVRRRASQSPTTKRTATESLDLARASFALAIDPSSTQLLALDRKSMARHGRLRFSDCERAARAAEQAGAVGWEVDALIALCCYYQGRLEEAYQRSEQAAGALPSGEDSWNAMAVLALFAESRKRGIEAAQASQSDWPPSWLADLNAAYSVLAGHPFGTPEQVAAQFDFLSSLTATTPAGQILELGLKRHPGSGVLHARLRRHLLREKGVRGLQSRYEALLGDANGAASLPWYAGLSFIVSAEYMRRSLDEKGALEAYARSMELFEISIQRKADWKDSSDHYSALALAGMARIELQREDLGAALQHILACLKRRPLSAASLDGLGFSPAGTSLMLRALLRAKGRSDEVELLQAALDVLDSIDRSLLDLPVSERGLSLPGR
jgi:hypothetical protein